MVEGFAVLTEESSPGGFVWGRAGGAGEQRKAQNLQALWMCVPAGHGAGMSTAVWGLLSVGG